MTPFLQKASGPPLERLRSRFLEESHFQFVHDKCHLYGWADSYIFQLQNEDIGYGSIWGLNDRRQRDTIFEFYLLPAYRKLAEDCFSLLCQLPGVQHIESQTNDPLLTRMLYQYAVNIYAEAHLFEDGSTTFFPSRNTLFRKAASSTHQQELPYELILNETILATGGLMLNYNYPYADIYMEVKEPYRRQGYGALVVQELKKAAYVAGRVPAARCNISNRISYATLTKAGFRQCGFILIGSVLHPS